MILGILKDMLQEVLGAFRRWRSKAYLDFDMLAAVKAYKHVYRTFGEAIEIGQTNLLFADIEHILELGDPGRIVPMISILNELCSFPERRETFVHILKQERPKMLEQLSEEGFQLSS